MLQSFDIAIVVDVRHFPGSRSYPHFNKEELCAALQQQDIKYEHLVNLGGRRKAPKIPVVTAWRHPAFSAYAAYMETEAFKESIKTLVDIATSERTAYMCSEAVWWRCHRALISDYLKAAGWTVQHIMTNEKAQEHPYTKPARIIDGFLTYNIE